MEGELFDLVGVVPVEDGFGVEVVAGELLFDFVHLRIYSM